MNAIKKKNLEKFLDQWEADHGFRPRGDLIENSHSFLSFSLRENVKTLLIEIYRAIPAKRVIIYIWLILGLFLLAAHENTYNDDFNYVSPVSEEQLEEYQKPTPEPAEQSYADPCTLSMVDCTENTPSDVKTAPKRSKGSISGLASYYSREGCIGCSPNMIMANGQPLDDNALTVAYNDAPLGTKLSITNEDTGESVVATVTDTGGFKRHGKIIDLTIATRDAISCASTCRVRVDVI